MEAEHYTQTLNPQQFEQALAILHREQQVNTPTPLQKRIFRILSAPIYGFNVVIVMGLLILYLLFMADHSGYSGDSPAFTPTEALILLCILLVVISVCLLVVGLLVLYPLNLSFLRELHRQNKLMKSLGLKEAIDQPWRKIRRKKTPREILFLCGSMGGLLTMLLLFGIGISILLEVIYLDFIAVGGAALLVVLSAFSMIAIVVINIARRNKDRLEFVSNLHRFLEEQLSQHKKGDESSISISAEEYQKIAQIERAQISRGRVQSILDSMEELDATPYVIQKSRAAQEAQDDLDAATRLRVQEQINDLMTAPRHPGVAEDSRTGNLELLVDQTSVIIAYAVDDNTRRIRIISVVNTSEGFASPSEHG